MNADKLPQAAIGFAVGMALGVGLGVLFAPASGEDTREYITGTAKDTVDRAVAGGRRLKRRAANAVDDARENLREAAIAGEQAYRDAQDA